MYLSIPRTSDTDFLKTSAIVTQPIGIYTLLCPTAFVLVDLQLPVGSSTVY
jgi:hypothetical protein